MTGQPERLTPFFKRIAFKKGRIAAIIATARKLAVIIWNMINKGGLSKRTSGIEPGKAAQPQVEALRQETACPPINPR
ncbi:hypothetical protein IC229_34780 [Spirosoma sp. BT702]|uniref:Uncharacterized protein n=1 Tax=Spirosoma profusum TaxID=2771354 RepID=A0A927GAU1_9BACT|nr:hypothetical protein [Spirosoma profusum]MBD2705817.1 hypothetical protein [Spirosoma profusum]